MYIWELPDWPAFRWDSNAIASLLRTVLFEQGRLIGRMESLGLSLRDEAELEVLTEESVRSSAIEGVALDRDTVRSSIARNLGIDAGELKPVDRGVEGLVDMVLDATRNYNAPLTAERLCAWHAALFPADRSGLSKITTGAWRTDERSPMQVVSGAMGKESVHFEAPPADRVEREITAFLSWFESETADAAVLRAGVAHLWFVTIHPFDDGNGRIGRAILDMALARADGEARRSYSMSRQIEQERRAYYGILEHTQKGSMDVTAYLVWFLECLLRAVDGTEDVIAAALTKARFWERHAREALNERQIQMITRLLGDFKGKLTSSKWAKISKCSQDTAVRDISDLVDRGILDRNPGGGRSTSYSLVLP